MYIPDTQKLATAGLAVLGLTTKLGDTVIEGKILDFTIQKCLDKDLNQRCSRPFKVTKNECYKIEWSTEGALAHTTAEVRDAGSGEVVFYRDTDGEWTPKKNELVYLDFMPKGVQKGNDTVEFKVTMCGKDEEL